MGAPRAHETMIRTSAPALLSLFVLGFWLLFTPLSATAEAVTAKSCCHQVQFA
jgi:hypothetical protein